MRPNEYFATFAIAKPANSIWLLGQDTINACNEWTDYIKESYGG